MKILVTGASGRVGANLVVALRERGHEVRAHIFPGDKAREAVFKRVTAEYQNWKLVQATLKKLNQMKIYFDRQNFMVRRPGPEEKRSEYSWTA